MAKYRRTVYALMSFLSLALLTTSSATDAKAPVQDPLYEKLDFLKANLERYLSHSIAQGRDAGTMTFEAVSFDSCKVTWKISTESGGSAELPVRMRNITIVNQISVNLSSLNPARTTIHVDEFMKQRNIPWALVLQLYVRAGTPGFTQHMVVSRPGQVTRIPVMQVRQSSFYFDLGDQRIAEEVSKAFADASAICQSRTQRAR